MPSPRAAFPLQPKAQAAALLAAGLILAACGGGGGGGGSDPVEPGFTGREVKTEGIKSYTTDHNGFTRARIDLASTPADRDALAGFDNGGSPAGYARLIKDAENSFPDKTFVEVIAEVAPLTGSGEKVVKVLRLTADQAPFDNVDSSGTPSAAANTTSGARATSVSMRASTAARCGPGAATSRTSSSTSTGAPRRSTCGPGRRAPPRSRPRSRPTT